jgi:hypothetical protein
MSRVYDRLMAGSRPLNLGDIRALQAQEPDWDELVEEALTERGITPSPENVRRYSRDRIVEARSAKAPDRFDVESLDGVPVIAADDVANYLFSLPDCDDLHRAIDVVAPPLERFWVEFQGVENRFNLRSWGLLFESMELEDESDRAYALRGWEKLVTEAREQIGEELSAPEPRWILRATLFVEFEKGDPVGPVIHWDIGVDPNGHETPRSPDGSPWHWGTLAAVPTITPEDQQRHRRPWEQFMATGLMTISFMHCKNVDLVSVDQPAALSKKWSKRTGRPLVRYRVLEINPMRRILDREGGAQRSGLKQALHICRGHFKTFTDEAPLFGRFTGKYWWASHVRAKDSEEVVIKDYAVRLTDGELGRPYVNADEHLALITSPEGRGNPDLSGRGLSAHNRTQNALARAVEAAGWSPRTPKPDEPQFDLGWSDGSAIWVAEVKSTTLQNEERQLRLAVGQVLRYRQLIESPRHPVRPIIAIENAPYDDTWIDLCAKEEIVLVWPEVFEMALKADA